jgi:hypothetical protein
MIVLFSWQRIIGYERTLASVQERFSYKVLGYLVDTHVPSKLTDSEGL